MTKYFLLFFTIISSVVNFNQGAKLPTYIQQCSRSDPQIAKCFIKNGNAAISSIVKGDKKYKVPVMTPLKIEKINIDPSPDFHMMMENIELYGLENTEVIDAEVDLQKHTIRLKVRIPVVALVSKYESQGRLININFEGKGDSNITLTDGIYDYKVQLEIYQKGGKNYYKLKDSEVNYDFDKAYYYFGNLFNGNKLLENEINKFMNEHPKELSEEFRPTISRTIATIINSIMAAIVKLVPVEEVFAP